MGDRPFDPIVKLLLGASDNPLIVADAEGKVFDLNERCARLFGLPGESLIGRDLGALGSGQLALAWLAKADPPGIRFNGPSGESKMYGARIMRSGAGAAGSYSLIELYDVSVKEDLEGELAAERDRFRTIINSMGDGLGIVDKNFKIRFMNKVLSRITGENALGNECYKVYTGNDAPCFNCPLKRGIENLDTNTVEVTGSNERSFLITHSPIRDAEGNIAVLEILKDVTESKKLEKKLLDSERRAILSQFSSTLAHDLRNPIVGINKTVQMLLSNYDQFDKDFHLKKLADLSSSSALLLGLVNDMLDVFQDSYASLAMRKSLFDFNEAVNEVLPLLKADAEEKEISLSFAPCRGEPSICADKRRLQRVIINLLDNAIKFTPSQKSIALKARRGYSRRSGAKNLLFSVEDEGPGVRPERLEKIFDLFYKGENNAQSKSSTGIGLYFCKVIVEAHGGGIWAANKPEGGLAFKVSLPL